MDRLFQVVQEYERAVIFRLGRLMQGGAKGPGTVYIMLNLFIACMKVNHNCNHSSFPPFTMNLHYFLAGIFFILPCVDAYARVDLRTRTYDVPPQEVRAKFSQFSFY